MAHRDSGSAPPRQVVVGEGPTAVVYELVGSPGVRQAGAPAAPHHGEAPRPVYRQASGGGESVATGRLFVRMQAGLDAGRLAPLLEGTPLSLESRVGYAPHAAWLVASSGDPGEALSAIDRVKALPGVAHVEPELLRARNAR